MLRTEQGCYERGSWHPGLTTKNKKLLETGISVVQKPMPMNAPRSSCLSQNARVLPQTSTRRQDPEAGFGRGGLPRWVGW